MALSQYQKQTDEWTLVFQWIVESLGVLCAMKMVDSSIKSAMEEEA